MLRKVLSKFSKFTVERKAPRRRPHQAPIKITFDPRFSRDVHSSSMDSAFISGETVDISICGIGFSVPSIRIRENYLVGQERPLIAEIELPNGKITATLVGRRYEKVGQHLSTERFIIGAEIVSIDDDDKETLAHFIKYGDRKNKAARQFGLEVD